MAAVKKIAIIGFSVEQERTDELQISWQSGEGWKAEAKEKLADESDHGSERTSAIKKGSVFYPASASHIVNVYKALNASLEKGMGMGTVAPEIVRQNRTYDSIASLDRFTTRWIPMNTQPMDFFSLPGIAPPEKANYFTLDERRRIMQELGVDALAVAVVRLHYSRTDNIKIGNMFAMGSYTPSAQTTFTLYDGKDEEAIWKDFLVPGEQLDSHVFQIQGIANTDVLYKKAIAASELSFRRMIERYKTEVASGK